MIGIAFLCTQTVPSLRPPMSRVVAMLCGDVEVTNVTTKPGYLTDWRFDDVTSFIDSSVATTATRDTNNSDYLTSGSTSQAITETQHSSETGTTPILSDLYK